ncbi:hypothetical protein HRbin01_00576 [archaeon HR01]|nr:hypothetical protein HRbin01_00576 [archaeon HR01]
MRIVVRTEVVGFWDPFRKEEKPKEERPKEEKLETCVICGLEMVGGGRYTCPHCGCVGHSTCFDGWLMIKKTCPLCRRVIAAEAV